MRSIPIPSACGCLRGPGSSLHADNPDTQPNRPACGNGSVKAGRQACPWFAAPRKLFGGHGLAQPVADERRALDQGVELVLRDVALKQNQSTVGRDAQTVGGDDL